MGDDLAWDTGPDMTSASLNCAVYVATLYCVRVRLTRTLAHACSVRPYTRTSTKYDRDAANLVLIVY